MHRVKIPLIAVEISVNLFSLDHCHLMGKYNLGSLEHVHSNCHETQCPARLDRGSAATKHNIEFTSTQGCQGLIPCAQVVTLYYGNRISCYGHVLTNFCPFFFPVTPSLGVLDKSGASVFRFLWNAYGEATSTPTGQPLQGKPTPIYDAFCPSFPSSGHSIWPRVNHVWKRTKERYGISDLAGTAGTRTLAMRGYRKK